MGYYSKIPSNVKRTKGTAFFRVRNYISLAVLSVCSLIGVGIYYTPVMQKAFKELEDTNFGITQEEIDKKTLIMMSLKPFKAEALLKDLERDKDFMETSRISN